MINLFDKYTDIDENDEENTENIHSNFEIK